MCRLLFVTVFTYVFSVVTSRAVVPLEGPLWTSNMAEDITSQDDQLQFLPDIFEQKYPPQEFYNPDEDYNIIQRRPPNDKRALSMFSRWKFINDIGKERTPIRSKAFFPEESITTQTRSKMLGAPLRWG